jgi:hypothetical protein
VGALGAGLLLIGARLGLGPLAAIGALLPGQPQFAPAYALLLVGLYLYWRGTRLALADGAAIGALFGRGAVALVVALLLRPIFRPGVEIPAAALFGQVIAFVSLGLLGLALVHGEEEGSGGRLSWRWLLTMGLAIGGVLLLGGLVATALGGGAAISAAQSLIALILLPFALVGAGLAWLLYTLFAGPLGLLADLLRRALAQLPEPPEPPQEQAGEIFTSQDPGSAITALATSATWLMALIPIVVILLAILLLRRRRQGAARLDEERESLGLAESLAGDLRDLLGRLRNPFARPLVGLRAALAALAGADPASRVRRAYLRLLIDLEPRQPRPPAQTPAEYAAVAGSAAGAPAPVDALTRAYEVARYNPAGVDAAAAEAAESALVAISRAPRPE